MSRTFYVCSYGGSGSKMLWQWLRKYGRSLHIHSRKPPQDIEKVGGHVYHEWFNGIPVESPENYTVLYIYRDPIDAILSRFNILPHLVHVQVPKKYCRMKVLEHSYIDEDLYGLEEFFDNYTDESVERSYDIIAVKYETFFENIDSLKEILNLPSIGVPDPVRMERTKNPPADLIERLEKKYKGLREKMAQMPPVKVIRKKVNLSVLK